MTTIKLRRDTAANWNSVNPVLANGEPAIEVDTDKIKIGDGITHFKDLPYFLNESHIKPVYGADAVNNPSSALRLALDDYFPLISDVQGMSGGQTARLMARLAAGQENVVVQLLGDSTANGTNEWFYQLIQKLAADYPNYMVKHRLWNDTNQSYDAPTVLQPGSQTGLTTLLLDTASRADGELVGSTPDTGPAWAGTAGVLAVNGGSILAVTNVNGEVTNNVGQNDNITLTADITLVNFSSTGQNTRLYLKWVDGNNHVMAELLYSTSGVTLNLYKRINGTATSLGSAYTVITPPAAGGSVTVPLTLSVSGTSVSGTANGKSAGGSLGAGELTTGTKTTMTGPAGTRVDNWKVVQGSPAPILDAYNGSMPGAAVSYFTGTATRFDTMTPVAPDLAMFNLGHNHFEAVSQFRGLYYGLVRKLLAKYPQTPILCTSQNVRTAPRPASEISNHLQRMNRLRDLCGQEGWGYVPVIEAFVATGNPNSYVDPSDGIHPTQAGDDFWANEVKKHFAAPDKLTTYATPPQASRVVVDPSKLTVTNPVGAYPGNGAVANGVPAKTFDKAQGGSQGVGATLEIPSHWNTVNVYLVWSPSDATAGDVRWRFAFFPLSESAAPSSDSETYVTASASGVLDKPVKTTLRSGVAIPSRPLALRLLRLTADAADTYAAQAKLWYIMIERAD